MGDEIWGTTFWGNLPRSIDIWRVGGTLTAAHGAIASPEISFITFRYLLCIELKFKQHTNVPPLSFAF